MDTDNGDMSAATDTNGTTIMMRSQGQVARQFYSTGDYSDLMISCQGETWNVHKFQLCSQSEFFHTTCSGQFEEAHENKISLDDDDPQVVEAMLCYLYTGTYGDAGNGPADMPSILLDVAMFAIADKYFIKSLKDNAATKFSVRCERDWKTPEFATAIQQIYRGASGDNSLEEIVLATVKKHLTVLFRSPQTFTEFHKVIHSESSFSADILGRVGIEDGVLDREVETADLGKTTEVKWTFHCPDCACTFTVNVPLGRDITFSCPLGHNRKVFSGWTVYGKHAT